MQRAWLFCIAVQLCCTPLWAQPVKAPGNLDFESGAPGSAPPGWFVPTPGIKASISDHGAVEGAQCLQIVGSRKGREAPFGNVMQMFDAAAFRGKRVALSGQVRIERPEGSDARAQLWLRVDRAPEAGGNPRPGFFDNMNDRPVTSDLWSQCVIAGPVADDATAIAIGCLVIGANEGVTVWVDGLSFGVDDTPRIVDPPAPVSDRGMENLIALARLLGYVRYFHPSDQAAKADWDAIAIEGVRRVEAARDANDLAASLRALILPYAPTVRIETEPVEAPDADALKQLANGDREPREGESGVQEPGFVIAWRHHGLGPQLAGLGKDAKTIYRSSRVRRPIGEDPGSSPIPPLGAAIAADLGGGVWCSVPITLCADSRSTLPVVDEPASPRDAWPVRWRPLGDDRAVRLADVILCWNALQHFYPYFDAVDSDWAAELPAALRRAGMDADEGAFVDTLRRMLAALHDGHVHVGHASRASAYTLPIAWDWVEDQLVVTQVAEAADGPERGDVVVSIDGVPARTVFDEARALTSGATAGWINHQALQEMLRGDSSRPVLLVLESPGGAQRGVALPRAVRETPVVEPRPKPIAELSPGIWYVDIDRIDDAAFRGALPDLEKAAGIVFDLRGYPGKLSTIVLAHLIDTPITCSRWNVPIITWPDGLHRDFEFSNWTVRPARPRLKCPTAFIIDGRAISYAETYMAMVENYALARIVGQPTAGTNGNVNSLLLPGGYSASFTGMKVLRHDGSQYHGKPVQPTDPVNRTRTGIIEGRDELLDRAVEIVSPD
ncbi:MAG: hypothetical protein KF745_02040 [Phycisphaeraceae bacterium]|nr:hypothetical protein [Phycisphaeraceae bacterium]